MYNISAFAVCFNHKGDVMASSVKRLRFACYTSNISMSVVSTLSPLLFLTFREQYGVSYSLLGLLVLINFVTQLTIDLIFSFFSHKFNIAKTVKFTPLLTSIGLILYALAPVIFPQNIYLGLAVGTVVFSVSGGLSEVLISPVIAAIPSENPEREMSKLHSMYAWGVVGVVILSTLFLLFFGSINWMYLALLWSIVPLTAFLIFLTLFTVTRSRYSGPSSCESISQTLIGKPQWFVSLP